MNIVELKNKKINELTKLAKQLNIDGAAGIITTPSPWVYCR